MSCSFPMDRKGDPTGSHRQHCCSTAAVKQHRSQRKWGCGHHCQPKRASPRMLPLHAGDRAATQHGRMAREKEDKDSLLFFQFSQFLTYPWSPVCSKNTTSACMTAGYSSLQQHAHNVFDQKKGCTCTCLDVGQDTLFPPVAIWTTWKRGTARTLIWQPSFQVIFRPP